MIQITLPYLYNLAQALEPLERQTPGRIFEKFQIYHAEAALFGFLNGSVYSDELRSCYARGKALLDNIRAILDQTKDDDEAQLSEINCSLLRQKYEEFRTVFTSELSVWPAYFVTRKGGFDSLTLLETGERIFPDSLISKVPEALADARGAGTCLAYGCNTACGFHTFRAVESVLRRYWDEVSDGTDRPTPETLGKIASELEQRKLGEIKVIEALRQLAKLHRNPIAHPDVVLSEEEAIGVVGMAGSVVAEMLKELSDKPLTTSTPLNL